MSRVLFLFFFKILCVCVFSCGCFAMKGNKRSLQIHIRCIVPLYRINSVSLVVTFRKVLSRCGGIQMAPSHIYVHIYVVHVCSKCTTLPPLPPPLPLLAGVFPFHQSLDKNQNHRRCQLPNQKHQRQLGCFALQSCRRQTCHHHACRD